MMDYQKERGTPKPKKPVSPKDMAGQPDWTVLVFMVPDEGLERSAFADIKEMQSVPDTDRFNLLVQMHRPDGTDRFRIVNGEVFFEDDPPFATIEQSLASFVDWGFTTYQSTYKMVILWGHSYGVGMNLFSPRQDLRGVGETPGPRTIVPRASLSTLFSGNGVNGVNPVRVVDRTQNSLSIQSLAQLLKGETGRGKIDVLGMDSCYMSSAEAAFELRHATEYLVASESFIREQGWDYAKVFALLANNPSIGPEPLGQGIVRTLDESATRTISLLKLSGADDLAREGSACMDALLELVKDDPAAKRALKSCFERTSFLKVRQFLDLRDLVDKLKAEFPAVAEQLDNLDDEAAAVIIAARAFGEGVGLLQGLSIYYPHVEAVISLGAGDDNGEVNAVVDLDEYATLEFVQQTSWKDVLNALGPPVVVPAGA
jgi:hypothetical protein